MGNDQRRKNGAPLDLDLHRLAVFCAVVQEGSLSKASRKLYISQPAVSGHIRALERQLGLPLFDRVGRRAVVNEAGRALYRKAEALFAVAEEIRATMDQLRGASMGRLALAASAAWEPLLPPRLMAFKECHPHVELRLSVTSSAQVERLVLDRAVDLGFSARRPQVGRLEALKAGKVRLVPICAPGGPLAKAEDRQEALEALQRGGVVLREEGSAVRQAAEGLLRALGYDPGDALVVDSQEAVKRAVARGVGVGFVTWEAAVDEVEAGFLISPRLPFLTTGLELYVLRRAEVPARPLAEALVEAAVSSNGARGGLRKGRPT